MRTSSRSSNPRWDSMRLAIFKTLPWAGEWMRRWRGIPSSAQQDYLGCCGGGCDPLLKSPPASAWILGEVLVWEIEVRMF